LMFPAWRVLREYAAAVRRAPLTSIQRVRCYQSVVRSSIRNRAALVRDVRIAAARRGGVGPLLARQYQRHAERRFMRRARKAARDVATVVPHGETLILVDEALFGPEPFARWQTIPFPERDGAYAGPPNDDRAATREIERLRGSGAHFMALAWPAFWWMQHYREMNRYVSERFPCLFQNHRVMVFDLREAPDSPSRVA